MHTVMTCHLRKETRDVNPDGGPVIPGDPTPWRGMGDWGGELNIQNPQGTGDFFEVP